MHFITVAQVADALIVYRTSNHGAKIFDLQ